MRGFGIVVYLGVFPAVAQVALVSVEAHEPSFPNQPESLCRFAVVFVNLRQSIGKWEFLVENGVTIW